MATNLSNLQVRIIAASVLLPAALGILVFGHASLVFLFLSVSMSVAVLEVASMLFPAFEQKLAGMHNLDKKKIFPFITVGLGWAMMLASTKGQVEVSVGTVAIAALAALLIGAFSAPAIDLAVSRSFGILISLCYGALPWMVIWQLYRMAPGARYVILVMAVTWCGDTGGYFGGRFLGGKVFGDRKLAPVISPKKTWEGAISGLILSVVGALACNAYFAGTLAPAWLIILVAVFGGAFAQLGDLVESTFKRFAGVKDSGVIIPGHGGFLDRVDGILFAAPVIWAILYYFQ